MQVIKEIMKILKKYEIGNEDFNNKQPLFTDLLALSKVIINGEEEIEDHFKDFERILDDIKKELKYKYPEMVKELNNWNYELEQLIEDSYDESLFESYLKKV